MTDHLTCRRCRGIGLRVVNVAGQRIDDMSRERRTVLRGERGPRFALEVVSDDEFLTVSGNDQVVADPRVVTRKQQMRIGND